ncbi:MAG: hypothetical protein ACOX4F_08505 [Atopobiaceae bacterium]|jgi:hypothetical protein
MDSTLRKEDFPDMVAYQCAVLGIIDDLDRSRLWTFPEFTLTEKELARTAAMTDEEFEQWCYEQEHPSPDTKWTEWAGIVYQD